MPKYVRPSNQGGPVMAKRPSPSRIKTHSICPPAQSGLVARTDRWPDAVRAPPDPCEPRDNLSVRLFQGRSRGAVLPVSSRAPPSAEATSNLPYDPDALHVERTAAPRYTSGLGRLIPNRTVWPLGLNTVSILLGLPFLILRQNVQRFSGHCTSLISPT